MQVSEIGRPKARLKNPLISGQLYNFRQPQWDVYEVDAATLLTRQRLFQIPIGQQYTPAGGAAQVKTLYHTSMVQAGILPNPNKLYAKAISISLRADVYITDAVRFLADTVATLEISGRSFLDIHAFKAPQAGGLFGFNILGAPLTNGWPDAKNQFEFSDALGEIIEQGQNFAVILDPTQVVDAQGNTTYTTQSDQQEAGGTGINCHVYLDGLLNRVVL